MREFPLDSGSSTALRADYPLFVDRKAAEAGTICTASEVRSFGKEAKMNETDKDPSYLHDGNYRDLIAYYVDHPIALYTGAGVSWSDSLKFGVGLWDNLVRNILVSDKNISPGTIKEFDETDWKDQPWEMAEWVAGKIGNSRKFKRRITALVQKEENFQKKYKLLSGEFLKNARTLNTTVAFCADLAAGKITKGKNGQWSAVYQRSINRRIHAVVTSNYDPFLEAASSTMFRKPILKPVAAQGSSTGSLMEIPVFHIHGYVEFPAKFLKQKTIKRKPFVEAVITTSDYKSAWRSDNVFNFTMGPQIHILRHYTVLFIGFSFRDEWVRKLLKDLNTERRKRKDRLFHYAIMKKADADEKVSQYLEKVLGVKLIIIDDFPQIKDLLSHLYQQGLIHDHHGSKKIEIPPYEGRVKNEEDKTVCLTPEEYFEELYNCRLSMVHKEKSYIYSD